MARSPAYDVPPGLEGHDLAGVKPCGHVSAALAIDIPGAPYARATQKDVRDFYASMAETGRAAVWMPSDKLDEALREGWNCKCRLKGSDLKFVKGDEAGKYLVVDRRDDEVIGTVERLSGPGTWWRAARKGSTDFRTDRTQGGAAAKVWVTNA